MATVVAPTVVGGAFAPTVAGYAGLWGGAAPYYNGSYYGGFAGAAPYYGGLTAAAPYYGGLAGSAWPYYGGYAGSYYGASAYNYGAWPYAGTRRWW